MRAMTWSRINHRRVLRYAGLFTYLSVGVPLFQKGQWSLAMVNSVHWGDPVIPGWLFSYLGFGLAYLFLTASPRMRQGRPVPRISNIIGLVVLTASAIAVGWFSQSGLSAMLMLVIAMVLPWQLPALFALLWTLAQNLLLIPVIAHYPDWNYQLAALQVCVYLGLAMVPFFTSFIASQQAEERDLQRRLNSELRATRAMLAESTRIAERMRIARDLHDLIGHHLTALSLNLEVASHLSNESALEHIKKAQVTARHLLADVREAVSELRQDDAIDLTQALQSLIEGVPGIKVHIAMPPRFSIEDPRRAQVILRCAQEILTNAVRHANARNLWFNFAYAESNLLGMHARDDGRGAAHFQPGNGLTGMRERLAEFGGTVLVETSTSDGFALTLRLPLGERPALAHAADRSKVAALRVASDPTPSPSSAPSQTSASGDDGTLQHA